MVILQSGSIPANRQSKLILVCIIPRLDAADCKTKVLFINATISLHQYQDKSVAV